MRTSIASLAVALLALSATAPLSPAGAAQDRAISPSVAGAAAGPGLGPIPADFPIDRRLFASQPSEGGIEGPSTDLRTYIPIRPCGRDTRLAQGATGRLAVRGFGPEFADVRLLLTFEDHQQANRALNRVRRAVRACARDDKPRRQHWQVLRGDTGYVSLSFAQTYRRGLGGYVAQLTRVGHSLLLVAHGGEYHRSGTQSAVPVLTQVTRRIGPEMCLFTADGC